jgi:hypothetical protein
MLLEEDVVMERHEEIRQPIRPLREPDGTAPTPATEQHCDADEPQPLPLSPPPMPWPRVFPGL